MMLVKIVSVEYLLYYIYIAYILEEKYIYISCLLYEQQSFYDFNFDTCEQAASGVGRNGFRGRLDVSKRNQMHIVCRIDISRYIVQPDDTIYNLGNCSTAFRLAVFGSFPFCLWWKFDNLIYLALQNNRGI